jgi:phosphoesterase RecJ-like protein
MNLERELSGARSVAIAAHLRPDGDAVGSSLGLYHYLKANMPELEVTVYLEEVPDQFRILKGTDEICSSFDAVPEYDVFLALDCADHERLGKAASCFDRAKKTICIDHHISNIGYAQINEIRPDASSTSEIVFSLLDPEKITKECAEALYLGIIHDTGVFRHSCTAPSTMEAAAELMRHGIDTARIINDTYYDKTYHQNQILGRALLESILLMDGKIIFSVVRKKEMKFYGVGPADLDGIVQTLMGTKGVEAAIFLYETAVQEYKVSMRSRGNINVSAIASYFGGGGHIQAAGCTMQGSIYDVVNNITYHMEQQLLQSGL